MRYAPLLLMASARQAFSVFGSAAGSDSNTAMFLWPTHNFEEKGDLLLNQGTRVHRKSWIELCSDRSIFWRHRPARKPLQ